MPATLQRLPAAPRPRPKEEFTLIDKLLAEQSTLQTPVARFSEHHDRKPDLEPHYRTLIPLTRPGADEQYAFEVSLDRCTGCKACVSACHSLNGLDAKETWRDTGVLLGGSAAPGWQQTITSACHHCGDPACMNGCPVGAYEKDPETGIVRHLDDQCIGCSYCILKCPYDVPKYSKKRGIVRKCDMCHQRLAEGEAPACVQACPTEAIRIVKVSRHLDADLFPAQPLHAASAIPPSSITLPTTKYVGRFVPETAFAADRETLVPQHAHRPLVGMLVLTQAGIGLLAGASSHPLPLWGALLFNLGMISAVFHLGQPLKAWRFFLGLRTSWLSREILAFTLFAPLPFVVCALPFVPDVPFKNLLSLLTSHALIPVGLLAVFTSVMIYHDTGRALWRLPRSATRFFGTVAAFAFLTQPWVLCAIMLVKTGLELFFLRHASAKVWTPDQTSARLIQGPLRQVFLARLVLALAACGAALIHPFLALPFLLASEWAERQLFFQSVHAPKMPGSFSH